MFERQGEIRKKENNQRGFILKKRKVNVRKRIKNILQNRQQTHPNRHISQISVRCSQILFFRQAKIYFTTLVSVIPPSLRKRVYFYFAQILPHNINRVNIDDDFY